MKLLNIFLLTLEVIFSVYLLRPPHLEREVIYWFALRR
jgi:hypothetical protein